jgi:aldehyde:ferredoxin oxidoreductase
LNGNQHVVRINVREEEIRREPVSGPDLLWGGRGYIAKTLLEEVRPGCDPLGPENKLIFATGILPDARIPGSGRLSVGAKSPLTGGIKESNAGGQASLAFARLGIRSLVLEGDGGGRLRIIRITKRGIGFEDASAFARMGNYDLAGALAGRYGKNNCIISVGPAAEMLLPTACIAVTDKDGYPGRFAGRGGLGAVMASKGIKAIVVEIDRTVHPLPGDDFKELLKKYVAAVRSIPLTAEALPRYGTNFILAPLNAIGALPTRNFSRGSFRGAARIDAEALYGTIVSRGGKGRADHACTTGCIVKCSNVYPDEKGEVLVSPLEYETISMVGSNLEIDSLDDIARINYICNDLGVDTIEIGGAMGVAMELGYYRFGRVEDVMDALDNLKKGTILGRVIGQGTYVAGRVLGSRRIPAVKGQGLPGYDPRGIKGIGVTMATSPMGADHTAGHTFAAKINHHKKEGQVEVSRNAQIQRALLDTLGWCSFYSAPVFGNLELIADMINRAYNANLSAESLLAVGRQTLKRELEFNARAGIGRESDGLPEFFSREPLPDFGTVFDFESAELEETLKDL